MSALRGPTYRSEPESIAKMNAGIRKMSASGKLLINPPENRRTHAKIIFNSPSWMARDIAKNLDHITGIEFYGPRVVVKTGLHNIYPQRRCIGSGNVFPIKIPPGIPNRCFVNAADALEAIVEFHFTGAFPDPREGERVVRQIMVRFRAVAFWPEKFAPLNRCRPARREALPRFNALNVYRAKQIWFQVRFDPDRISAIQPIPLCAEIYLALREGREFWFLLAKTKHADRGRPRGATSRDLGKVIQVDFTNQPLKKAA